MATTSPAPEDDRKMMPSRFRSRVLRHVERGHERREQMKRLMLGFAVVVAVAVAVAPLASATPRSGDLVVTKECSGFVPTNNPPYCTITSSNLGTIPDGSRIFYLDPNGLGTPTGGAVVLDPPGRGTTRRLARASSEATRCAASSRAEQERSLGSTPASWSRSPIQGRPMSCGTGKGRTASTLTDCQHR
jgi:hypothetical protein